MNQRTIRNGVAALVLATVMLLPVAFTGCSVFGQKSAQKIAYTTLANVGYTTDAALKAYLDLVAKDKVKADGLPKVTQQYTTFQSVYNAALSLAQGNTNALAPAHVIDASTATINLIEKVKVAP